MRVRPPRSTVEVRSPMAGTVVALEDVPDPVFSGNVVGPGLAILPHEPPAPAPYPRAAAEPHGSGRPAGAAGTASAAEPERLPPAGDPDAWDRRVVVVAPCAGRIVSVYPHALMLQLDAERSLLVHLGLDTGQLEGRGFHVAATEGERVTAGHPLLAWSPTAVRSGGRSTLTPVVALQAHEADLVRLVRAGQVVAEGEPVLLWS